MGYLLVMALAVVEVIFFLVAWRLREFIRDDNWILFEIWSALHVALTIGVAFLVIKVSRHYFPWDPQISVLIWVIPVAVVGTIKFIKNGNQSPKFVEKKKDGE
jgi:hypothetical protein